MTRLPHAFLAALAIAACSSSDPAPPATTTAAGLTWHHDVRPIVETKCATCHAAGGFAPFALGSYADAVAHKGAIVAEVSAKIMPPWPPSSACNTYQHDRSLTDAERSAITTWARGDAAEGDPATYTAPAVPAPPKIRADASLPIATPYTPVESPDEYRCFVLDWNATTSKFVTGLAVRPGNAPIVHHAIVFAIGASDAATIAQLDAADPAPGYRCFGGPGVDGAQWLGGWVPGGGATRTPEGTGIEVAPGSKIVLQMHYNTANAPPAPDRSAVDLELADSVAVRAAVLKFANPSWVKGHTMNIAAGDPDSVQKFAADLSPVLGQLTNGVLASNAPFQVHVAGLHMHARGKKATLRVVHPDGTSDCALEIDDWSFHWQGTYALARPIAVKPGDQISLECHFDNSGARNPLVNGQPLPVGNVNWGETTEDEMCLGILFATP